MKFINKPFSLLLLLVLGLCLAPVIRSASPVADDDDEDAVVNDEVPVTASEAQAAAAGEDDEGAEDRVTSSPFVKANVLFVQPESTELPAGRMVRMLVGFHNNGSSNFVVEGIDGAFRYPQDFSYYIQNFTAFEYNKVVEASKEATFEYMFTPSETFSSRQFGLTINMRYRNADGKMFMHSVFNETINVIEPEEGLDGETFFLYIFLAALVALLLFALQHFFSIFSKKRRVPGKQTKAHSNGGNGAGYSNGSGLDDVDFEWIPKEHLQPNKSPRQSPRKRQTRAGGSDDEQQ